MSVVIKDTTLNSAVSWQEWPASELEQVDYCPVCLSAAREVLHEGLFDNVFFVAPGRWTMHRCDNCRSAYLNPRPSVDFIGRAYENYYTHISSNDANKVEFSKLNTFRQIRRKLANGYVRWRFSSNAVPASRIGVLLAFLIPGMRRLLDREYRHLPRPNKTAPTLLDLGSGNGAFLKLASECGWDVFGLDPDPGAIEASIRNGVNAYQGGIERFDKEKELFDAVTISHVIEHLHDPSATISKCFELLKPGGSLWLETPNIDSLGSLKFGKHWRGVEAPRHLVLFNTTSLKATLSKAGFTSIKTVASPSAVRSIFEPSYLISSGISPNHLIPLTLKQKISILFCILIGLALPSSREMLTMVAKKPLR
jgi:2-polyprenyl-3-methyl-5-hydroxy-6-metoxy-1,4-benzoquinol methylase